jgi:hypothetical protein
VQVKLCTQCPYSPRDLADHYDIDAALHLCARCDAKFGSFHTLRRRRCRARTINATGSSGPTKLRAVPSAMASLVSFAIIAAARPCVRPGASTVSSFAVRTIAAGYGDFELPEHGSVDQNANFRRSGVSDEEPEC